MSGKSAAQPGTITTEDLSKLIGRSTRRVQQLAKQTVGDGDEAQPIFLSVGHGRYHLAASIQGYIKYLESQIDQGPSAKERKLEAEARKAELEVAVMEGRLIPVDDVTDTISVLITNFRQRVLGIPTKIVREVTDGMPLAEKSAVVEKIVRDALEALAETKTTFVRKSSGS